MRAMLVERAEAAAAVAEHHKVLAQEPEPHRRAVALRHFLGHAGGEPVPAHDAAHRPIALDAAEEIVFLGAQHETLRFALTRNP